jgi:hypothetical protein
MPFLRTCRNLRVGPSGDCVSTFELLAFSSSRPGDSLYPPIDVHHVKLPHVTLDSLDQNGAASQWRRMPRGIGSTMRLLLK